MHLSAPLGSCQVVEAVFGYECYADVASTLQAEGADGLTDFFMELQVYGTPQQCYDRIKHIHEQSQCCASINAFKFGGMPFRIARRRQARGT